MAIGAAWLRAEPGNHPHLSAHSPGTQSGEWLRGEAFQPFQASRTWTRDAGGLGISCGRTRGGPQDFVVGKRATIPRAGCFGTVRDGWRDGCRGGSRCRRLMVESEAIAQYRARLRGAAPSDRHSGQENGDSRPLASRPNQRHRICGAHGRVEQPGCCRRIAAADTADGTHDS